MKTEEKFVYFDLDGTLLNSEKQLTTDTLNSIKKLQKQNYKIGIATGRPPYMIKNEHHLLKPDLPVITTNGAFVTNKYLDIENPLETTYLNNEVAYLIFKQLFKMNITFLIYSSNTQYYFEEEGERSYWIKWLKDTISKRKESEKWKLQKINSNFEINKIGVLKFLIVPDTNAKKTLKELSLFLKNLEDNLSPEKKFTFLPSQNNVLDIFNSNVSKGSFLTKMAKLKLMNLKNLTVFGDALNDVSLFKVASVSIAMENAPLEIKQIATHVTKSNNENGVAFFIEKRMLNAS